MSGEDASHTCQRCHQPLLADPSIASLDPSSYSLITSALPVSKRDAERQDPASRLQSLPPSSQHGAAVWAHANPIPYEPRTPGVAESFVLLSESVSPSLYQPSPHRQASRTPTAHYHESGEPSSSSVSRLGPDPDGPLPPSRLADNLHTILSDRTNITHPLCAECTGLLQAELQKQLEELTRERDAYIAFERGILRHRDERTRKSARTSARHSAIIKGKSRGVSGESSSGSESEGLDEDDIEGTESEWEELQRQRTALEREEAELLRQLAEKEKELDRVREEEERIAAQEAEVERAETEFLYAHAERSADVARKEAALQTAKTHLLLSQSLLHHLEHVNVWNDAFHIGLVSLGGPSGDGTGSATGTRGRSSLGHVDADRTVGTINGLRLGGRPSVDWDEINAAWGLVALCIDRLAAKLNIVFESYRIVPLGSCSRIEELPPKRDQYELYASGDLTAILQKRRFSTGLVALLDCIRQLLDWGKRHDRKWAAGKPEYKIHKDKINGLSIRLPGLSSASLLPSMSLMGLGGSTSMSDSSGDTLNASGEELWNRACRLVLEVLKRILVRESEADRPSHSAQ